MKRFGLVLGGAAVAALLVAGWYLWGPATVPAGQPPLVALNPENFAQLKAAFNAAPDSVRLVALLSPT